MNHCIKRGKWYVGIAICILVASGTAVAGSNDSAISYEDTVAQWKSYQDVANWFVGSFGYDRSKLLGKKQMPQSPAETFRLRKGICYDAANFAINALNRIESTYDARAVFIKNRLGPPHGSPLLSRKASFISWITARVWHGRK